MIVVDGGRAGGRITDQTHSSSPSVFFVVVLAEENCGLRIPLVPENTEPITKEGRGTSAYLIRSRSLDDNRWLLTPAGPGEFGVSAARRVRPIGCIEIIDSGKGRILRLSIVVCLGAFDSGRAGREKRQRS